MDRRTLKTRRALHVALLRLLTQRAWDEIDVQSLCEEADVGRSTFYEHYRSREALMVDAFSQIGAGFAATGATRDERTEESMGFLLPLVEHMHEQRMAFRSLLGRRANAHVRQQFQCMLVDLIRAEFVRLGLKPRWRLEALIQAIGGAAFATLHWWITGNEPRSPEEIATLINSHAHAMASEAGSDVRRTPAANTRE